MSYTSCLLPRLDSERSSAKRLLWDQSLVLVFMKLPPNVIGLLSSTVDYPRNYVHFKSTWSTEHLSTFVRHQLNSHLPHQDSGFLKINLDRFLFYYIHRIQSNSFNLLILISIEEKGGAEQLFFKKQRTHLQPHGVIREWIRGLLSYPRLCLCRTDLIKSWSNSVSPVSSIFPKVSNQSATVYNVI